MKRQNKLSLPGQKRNERLSKIWENKSLLVRQKRNERLLKNYNGKVQKDEYLRKEQRWGTTVTVVNYGKDLRLQTDKYNLPISENDGYWILKASCIAQPNNDLDSWIARKENIGYQYLCCHHRKSEVARKLKRKLKRIILCLIYGLMRINISSQPKYWIINKILKNIDLSIAIFREFDIEYGLDTEPQLVVQKMDLITSGYMRRYEIHIAVLHKIIESYIDPLTGMFITWNTESELIDI